MDKLQQGKFWSDKSKISPHPKCSQMLELVSQSLCLCALEYLKADWKTYSNSRDGPSFSKGWTRYPPDIFQSALVHDFYLTKVKSAGACRDVPHWWIMLLPLTSAVYIMTSNRFHCFCTKMVNALKATLLTLRFSAYRQKHTTSSQLSSTEVMFLFEFEPFLALQRYCSTPYATWRHHITHPSCPFSSPVEHSSDNPVVLHFIKKSKLIIFRAEYVSCLEIKISLIPIIANFN